MEPYTNPSKYPDAVRMDGKAELGAIVKSKPTVSEVRRRRAIAGTFCRNSRVSPAQSTFEERQGKP